MRRKVACALCAVTFALTGLTVKAEQRPVPGNNAFKTYMDYDAITNRNSAQYKMQQSAVTDENGLRVYDGKYCIAVGTYYASETGVEIDVTLESGRVLNCITGDIKSNAHTDSMNRQMPGNGNVVEFIVDTDSLPGAARKAGDISRIPGFEGSIVSIDVKGLSSSETYETTAVVEEVPESTYVDNYVEPLHTDSDKVYVVAKYTVDVGSDTLYFVDANILETYSVSKETYDAAVPGESMLQLNKETNDYEIV